ncbi:CDP-glycerol glycerophosphotransferase family protein [Streptomyces sp. NPDC047917]|uniref:CDP-glycerol glycerophosphotransferase family protein n=1 Tax=Streptomyces sp. NPDC047917 TaxID=3365491 RepID=UPI003724A5A9
MTGQPSAEELGPVSDALITDCSSLTYDYVCPDRPITGQVPDREACRASRGTRLDLLPGHSGDTPGRDLAGDRTATGERSISPVRERPRPVTPGPSRG